MVGIISWWYGRGWVLQWHQTKERFLKTLEFFSVGQLILTLFSPFRQISASGHNDGSLGDAARAMVDKLISRVIGALVRTLTIAFGLLVILLLAVYEVVIMIFWWLLPIMPVAGLILYAIGWTPQWI